MTPLLAFLDHDGRVVQTCIGCSQVLAGFGMLRVKEERALPVVNADAGTYSSIVYEIAAPFTIENCRAIVRDRHVGGAWPSAV